MIKDLDSELDYWDIKHFGRSTNGIDYSFVGTHNAVSKGHILVAISSDFCSVELMDWLREHIGEDSIDWSYQENFNNIRLFTFPNPEHAIRFKLTFG